MWSIGPEGVATLREWDRLSAEAAAAEERDESIRQARFGKYRNRLHGFIPCDWCPGVCDLCNEPAKTHGSAA